MGVLNGIKSFFHSWNVFNADKNKEFNRSPTASIGGMNVTTQYHYNYGTESSIMGSIINRISMDVASYNFHHIKKDDAGHIQKVVNSSLNRILNVEANVDQSHTDFLLDIVSTMLYEGVAVVVPITTSTAMTDGNLFDILTARVGIVKDWYTDSINIKVYNELTGSDEYITLPKKNVAIIVNPLYNVMNHTNSTLARLVNKLSILDAIDQQSGSGKLDIIIQLPYLIKNELKKQQAEERRQAIEEQLQGSKYGIAYIDGSEHITQLNRPSENNLLAQIEYLTKMLYSQIGIPEDVFNGTASALVYSNYLNSTIEPIINTITNELTRKFISKTAYTQGQRIAAYRDVLSLMPANEIATIADSLTRNEILTSNEIRDSLGFPASDNPDANALRNKNMPVQDGVESNPDIAEEEIQEDESEVEMEE